MIGEIEIVIVDGRSPAKDGTWLRAKSGEWIATIYDDRFISKADKPLTESENKMPSRGDAEAFARKLVELWNASLAG